MAMATRSGRKRARGGVRMGERTRKVRGRGEDDEKKSDDEFDVQTNAQIFKKKIFY